MINVTNTNTLNSNQARRIPRYGSDLLKTVFPPEVKRPKTKNPKAKQLTTLAATASTSLDPDLHPVCQSISQRHPELWSGNWQQASSRKNGLPYESQSQADLALASHIAIECINLNSLSLELHSAVEQVFSHSGLALRNKWTDRPSYRSNTIGKAIESCVTYRQPTPAHLPLDSYGDMRNGKAFAFKWRGRMVFVTTRDAWLMWDGRTWKLCEKDEHIASAKECCKDLLASASAVFSTNQDMGKKLVADAMAAHNWPKINAMLKMAVSEPQMAVTDKELDSNPMLLGVQNGVVDLQSGHLLFNQPEMLVTRYCDANYVADMPCPKWVSFLDQIFQGDIATIESVQRLLGYTLTGLVTEEVMVICLGYGSNGKSVFNNVVQRIMGGYSRTAPPSLLASRRADDSSPRNDLASLVGARYVTISELQAGDKLDEQIVKQLAGREAIAARFLHKEFFEFMPTFTAWLRTNHKPIVTGEDDGIWRRLVVIPFKRKFEEDEKDPSIEGKLLEERNGILMWMLEGTRMYLRDGLKLSPRIKAEAAKYRNDSDLIGEFLADMTQPATNMKVNQQSLFNSWKDWCESNGFRSGSKKTFTQRLAERGFHDGRSNGVRFYTGLKLL